MIVSVYNNNYNLESFIDNHPGGRTVFDQLEPGDDATALFNSYHSNCSRNKIECMLKQYKVSKCEHNTKYKQYSYRHNGFYRTVKRKVYEKYKNKSMKATWFWCLKVVVFIYLAYYFETKNRPDIFTTILNATITGFCLIFLTFNLLHDSSHYAISSSYKVNEFLSRMIQACISWNHYLWFRHHVYAHHSFTGEDNADPDLCNYKPFFQKRHNDKLKYPIPNQEKWIIPIIGFFPGQYFGQVVQYFLFMFKETIWGVRIDNSKCFKPLELTCYIFFTYFFYSQVYTDTLSFFIKLFILNMFYFLCIAPNHDTNESTVENHTPNTDDWGENQVRSSANFGTNSIIINELFGGINYQIEHHLFPDVCHVHYPEISIIVKETCKEFNIPHVELSWFDAIKSCLITYKRFNRKTE